MCFLAKSMLNSLGCLVNVGCLLSLFICCLFLFSFVCFCLLFHVCLIACFVAVGTGGEGHL